MDDPLIIPIGIANRSKLGNMSEGKGTISINSEPLGLCDSREMRELILADHERREGEIREAREGLHIQREWAARPEGLDPHKSQPFYSPLHRVFLPEPQRAKERDLSCKTLLKAYPKQLTREFEPSG